MKRLLKFIGLKGSGEMISAGGKLHDLMTDKQQAKKVVVNHVGRIAIIMINRPGRRNAVDGETAHLLFDAFKSFNADENFDVAILTGTGGYFCAGADLKSLADGGDINPIMEGGINSLGPMGPTRMRLEKPVIAVIEGHGVAGGLELALWCDLRVMAQDAVVGIYCRRFGVPLIDMGTIRLPRLIGQSRAMDMILTGREVNAQEAFDIGLANRLCEPGKALGCAMQLAEEISQHPQICMRNDRQTLYDQWSLNEEEAIRNENKLGLRSMHSGETLKGAIRFSEGEGRHGGKSNPERSDR